MPAAAGVTPAGSANIVQEDRGGEVCKINVSIRRKSGESAPTTGAERHIRYPAVTRSAYTDSNASQASDTSRGRSSSHRVRSSAWLTIDRRYA